MSVGRPWLPLALCVLVVVALVGQAPVFQEAIELCDFRVPRHVAERNLNFSVVYSLSVGRQGKPEQITKIKNDFLEDRAFSECLDRWRLNPSIGQVTVIFNWRHGQGWSEVFVNGSAGHRSIKFQPGWNDALR
jgi:hypothetical protein